MRYPGLGLPVQHYPEQDYVLYPRGLNSDRYGANSALLAVREVAMMNLMEKFTDRQDWHKMIFNDEIVDQWRKEALETPNRLYWKQATDNKGGNDVVNVRRPPGIMDIATFDYVCLSHS